MRDVAQCPAVNMRFAIVFESQCRGHRAARPDATLMDLVLPKVHCLGGFGHWVRCGGKVEKLIEPDT